jgi:hypothetical protein
VETTLDVGVNTITDAASAEAPAPPASTVNDPSVTGASCGAVTDGIAKPIQPTPIVVPDQGLNQWQRVVVP